MFLVLQIWNSVDVSSRADQRCWSLHKYCANWWYFVLSMKTLWCHLCSNYCSNFVHLYTLSVISWRAVSGRGGVGLVRKERGGMKDKAEGEWRTKRSMCLSECTWLPWVSVCACYVNWYAQLQLSQREVGWFACYDKYLFICIYQPWCALVMAKSLQTLRWSYKLAQRKQHLLCQDYSNCYVS